MKLTNLFENTIDHQQIEDWLDSMNIENYTINTDGTVDVAGNVIIRGKHLAHIPIQFGYVGGDFNCHSNQLTTLQGCPREVVGSFSCQINKLTTLQDGPKEVGGFYDCSYNMLTNLQGAPREIGGSFWCADNQLTSLQGGPREVAGDYGCSYNKLTDLKGGPIEVGGEFKCYANPFKEKPNTSFRKEKILGIPSQLLQQ